MKKEVKFGIRILWKQIRAANWTILWKQIRAANWTKSCRKIPYFQTAHIEMMALLIYLQIHGVKSDILHPI